jgi:hypothetical protein
MGIIVWATPSHKKMQDRVMTMVLLYIKGKIDPHELLLPVVELIHQASSVIILETKPQPQFVPFLGKDVPGGEIDVLCKTVLLVGADIGGRKYTAKPPGGSCKIVLQFDSAHVIHVGIIVGP